MTFSHNQLIYNEGRIIKSYHSLSSFIRESYVYLDSQGLEEILIPDVHTYEVNKISLPYIKKASNTYINYIEIGRLLRNFHDASYKKSFLGLNISNKKKYVSSKIKDLILQYNKDKKIVKYLDLALYHCSQCVVCHGDFSLRNILYSHSGEVKLIDFEATTIGPRSFDLAKFFFKIIFFKNNAENIEQVLEGYAAYEFNILELEINLFMLVHSLLALNWAKQKNNFDRDYYGYSLKTTEYLLSIMNQYSFR